MHLWRSSSTDGFTNETAEPRADGRRRAVSTSYELELAPQLELGLELEKSLVQTGMIGEQKTG